MMNIKEIFKKVSFKFIDYKIVVICSIVILIVGFAIIPNSFSQSLPIKSIEVFSENSNYKNYEAGAWRVTNSASLISKDKIRVTIDIDTVIKSDSNSATDIMFILDNSMTDERLQRVKKSFDSLLDNYFSNSNNRAGLISFNSRASLVSELTNDKEKLLSEVNLLKNSGDANTSYYQALLELEKILKNYSKDDSREFLVILLTDGVSNIDTANNKTYFSYLMEKYPYLKVNGIQYGMGSKLFSSLSEVSTNQFIGNDDNLDNLLFDMSINSKSYDDIVIEEKIDFEKFDITDGLVLKSSIGKVVYNKDEGKITWSINNMKSGASASLNFDLLIDADFSNDIDVILLNKELSVRSVLDGNIENITSSLSPIIKNIYTVTYDNNLPSGCRSSISIPTENKRVFDVVSLSDTKLKCSGYKFGGWHIVSKNAQSLNDDNFLMPEDNVVIRATWSKVAVNKSMNGKIYIAQTLLRKMSESAVLDDGPSQYVSNSAGIIWNRTSSDTNGKGIYIRASTKNDKYPVYYYRGNISNNNVKFAGFCWKIVRTTATGGIKMIYNGSPDSNGKCTTQSGAGTQIGTSKFNSKYDSDYYVGYMYGTVIGQNINNSDIKTYIDTWYSNNMVKYTKYLEDTQWCNDRSRSDSNFGEYLRIDTAPTLICPNASDKFTVNSVNGNGALTYPVALLQLEEASLAGNCFSCYSPSSYLNTGQEQWLLSPAVYTGYNYHKHFYISPNKVYTESLYKQYAVRPAIALKKEVEYSGGIGTPDNPYVIDTSN